MTGTLEFKKVNGNWRLDDLGTDLIRSYVTQILPAGYAKVLQDRGIAGTEDQLSGGVAVRRCLDAYLRARSDADQHEFGYALLGPPVSEEANPFGKLLIYCLPRSKAGRKAMRRAFELELRNKRYPPLIDSCVKRELPGLLRDERVEREMRRLRSSPRSIADLLTEIGKLAGDKCIAAASK